MFTRAFTLPLSSASSVGSSGRRHLPRTIKTKLQAGFTLIELMLVLAAIAILTTLALESQVHKQDQLVAQATGQQLKAIGSALNEYIVAYHDPLVNLVSAPLATQDGGPRNCNIATNLCSINVTTLINAGVLPVGFNGLTPFNSAYVIQIKRLPLASPGNYSLNGLVLTALPWTTGGATPRYDLLGDAMRYAGADAGYSRNLATEVDGYDGMWNATSANFPAINAKGLLGYQAGFTSAAYGAFLRIDGSNAMTGPLNMGGQTIYSAKDIQATGGVEAQSIYVDGGVIQLGPNAANQIFANATAGVQQTVFRQKDGILIVDSTGAPAPIAAVSDIHATGDITTNNGNIITGKTLQILNSNSTGNGTGLSLYNNGDLGNTGMIYTDQIQVATHPNSGINPQTDATTRFRLFGSGFSSYDWSVYRTLYGNSFDAIPGSGNLITFGDVSPTNVWFKNQVYLSDDLFMNKVVAGIGTACGATESGAVARTSAGALVICNGSTWGSTSILTTRVINGPQSNGTTPSYADCGSIPGSFAVGGGYTLTGFSAGFTYYPQAPAQAIPVAAGGTYPNGAFSVTSGSTASSFTPSVVCAVLSG